MPGRNSSPYIKRLWPSGYRSSYGDQAINRPINCATACTAHSPRSQSIERDKKLIQQAQQFHLAINFNRAAPEALPFQKSPEMFLSYSNCPAEIGERDPLRRSALTQFKKTLLDVMVRLGKQPLTQVLQNLLDLSTQFVDRDFAQVGGARGCSEFRDQLGREFVAMTLNHSNQC